MNSHKLNDLQSDLPNLEVSTNASMSIRKDPHTDPKDSAEPMAINDDPKGQTVIPGLPEMVKASGVEASDLEAKAHARPVLEASKHLAVNINEAPAEPQDSKTVKVPNTNDPPKLTDSKVVSLAMRDAALSEGTVALEEAKAVLSKEVEALKRAKVKLANDILNFQKDVAKANEAKKEKPPSTRDVAIASNLVLGGFSMQDLKDLTAESFMRDPACVKTASGPQVVGQAVLDEVYARFAETPLFSGVSFKVLEEELVRAGIQAPTLPKKMEDVKPKAAQEEVKASWPIVHEGVTETMGLFSVTGGVAQKRVLMPCAMVQFLSKAVGNYTIYGSEGLADVECRLVQKVKKFPGSSICQDLKLIGIVRSSLKPESKELYPDLFVVCRIPNSKSKFNVFTYDSSRKAFDLAPLATTNKGFFFLSLVDGTGFEWYTRHLVVTQQDQVSTNLISLADQLNAKNYIGSVQVGNLIGGNGKRDKPEPSSLTKS